MRCELIATFLVLVIVFCHAADPVTSSKVSERAPPQEPADGESLNAELVGLRVVSRQRGRRDLRKSGSSHYVVQLFSRRREKPLSLHLVKRYDIISPDFRLEVDPDDETRRVRKDSSDKADEIRSELMHSMYVGHTMSSEGLLDGQLAVSCFEGTESLRMIGIINLNGTHHEIYPSDDEAHNFSTSDLVKNTPHFIRPITPTRAGRKCTSRKPEGMPLTESPAPADPLEEDSTESPIQTLKNPRINSVKTNSRLLELAVFTDTKYLAKMKKRFPKDTVKNSVAYTLALVNNLNLLYKNPSLGKDNIMDIRLNYLEMLTKNVKALRTGKGREDIYLSSFCKFAANRYAKKAGWDHAMMLTGWDLRDNTGSGVIGVAWTAAMCDKLHSCSLVEATNFLGAYTMAHELGHSLGMPHDGESTSKDCNPTAYIMAAIEGPGQVDWSACSGRNLREFLRGKSAMPEATRPTCLRTSLKKNRVRTPISYTPTNKLPGEIFSAGQQCAMTFGKTISVPRIAKASICKELACGNRTSTTGIHPALEGTPCGIKRWCRNGSCIRRP